MASSTSSFGQRLLRTPGVDVLLRSPMLEQAVAHRPGVWVLKQHAGNPDEPVLANLRTVACLQGVAPSGMLGDSSLGCRTVTIHYAALESEHYFEIAASSIPPRSNAAALRL